MQTNEQTTNTPAPYKAKRKNAARRKACRAKKAEKIAAAKMRDKAIAQWIQKSGGLPTPKTIRDIARNLDF